LTRFPRKDPRSGEIAAYSPPERFLGHRDVPGRQYHVAVPVTLWEVFNEVGRGVGLGVARGFGRGVGDALGVGIGLWNARLDAVVVDGRWNDGSTVGVGLVRGAVALSTTDVKGP
jgi:hypothetical protein